MFMRCQEFETETLNSQDQDETETLNCWDRDIQKRLETLATETTSLVLSIDVLMKYLYFTTLLPKLNKATSHYCFIKSLLSADDF